MDEVTGPRRGELRIHLGAAPGVGKTYAMLCEAHRRLGGSEPIGRIRVERGHDVGGVAGVGRELRRRGDRAQATGTSAASSC